MQDIKSASVYQETDKIMPTSMCQTAAGRKCDMNCDFACCYLLSKYLYCIGLHPL